MKRKKLAFISMVMVFALIINIISPQLVVFANTPDLSINITTNPSSGVLNSENDIKIIINYKISNYSVEDGDKISIKLPNILKDAKIDFPKKHFKDKGTSTQTSDGIVYEATFGNQIKYAVQGFVKIVAKAEDVKVATKGKIAVDIEGIKSEKEITVNPKPVPPPPKPPEPPKPIERPDRYLYKTVNTNTIQNPSIGRVLNYTLYVDEKFTNINDAKLEDEIPSSLKFLENTARVYIVDNYGEKQDVTSSISKKYENGTFKVDFGKINSRYEVRYSCEVIKQETSYLNEATLYDGSTKLGSSSVKVDTFINDDIVDKVNKVYRVDERGNRTAIPAVETIGNQVDYVIDVNRNFHEVKNVNIFDELPEDTSIVPGSLKIVTVDVKNHYTTVTDKFKGNIVDKDRNINIYVGDTNYWYKVYYTLRIDDIHRIYNNKATVTADRINQTTVCPAKLQSGPGALNAWKEVDKTVVDKNGDQTVTYNIVFDSEGFFDKGNIKISDKINPDVKILKVEPSEQFSVSVDKNTNTVNIVNDKKDIKYGEVSQIKIVTDFTGVEEGTTIENVAKIKVGSESVNTRAVYTKKGYRFKATKIDAINKTGLKNVKFQLLDSSKKLIKSIASDENGIITSPIDKPGDYYIKEIQTIDGYKLDSKEIKLTIKPEDLGTAVDLGCIKNERLNHTFTIVNIDKNDKTKLLSNSKFTIKDNNDKEVGQISTNSKGMASIELPPGDYTVVQTTPPKGYVINSEEKEFAINIGKNCDVKIVIDNSIIKGNLEIINIDKNNSSILLEGTHIKLFDKNKKEISESTTDDEGKLVFNNLEYGTYYYKEIKVPKEYVIDNNYYSINIESNNTTVKRTMKNNMIKGSLEITKVDSDTKKALAGVEFTLLDKDNNELEKKTTDKEGKVVFDNLLYGNYSYKESKVIEGYVENNTMYTIKVENNNEVIEKIVENDKIKGSLEITKIDSISKELLKDVQFVIFDENNEEISKVTTNAEGKATIYDIEYGKYYFKEVKALEGYVINDKKYEFEIKTNNQKVEKVVENDKIRGYFQLFILDHNKKGVEGIEVEIYNSKKEPIGKFTTGKDGLIELADLEYGNYYYKEISVPQGYVINSNMQLFSIKEDNQVVKNNNSKDLIKGDLELSKIDSKSKKPLAGVEFTLLDKDKKEIEKKTTDKTGKVAFENLVYGTYYYKESKAIEGYVENDNIYPVKIENNNEVIKKIVENYKIKGNLEITKIDSESKDPLKGVEFTVFDKNNKEVSKLTTNDEGKAIFSNLEYGNYYYKETKALEGYVENNNKYIFEIKTNNQNVFKILENEKIKGSLEIIKVDSESKEPLKGVEFTVFDKNNKEVSKLTTNDEGKVIFNNLEYGNYYYKETKSLEGYVGNNNKYDFEIKTKNQKVAKKVENNEIDGDFGLYISNPNNKGIEGITVDVYNDDKKLIEELITDKNGKIELDNLDYGNYYYKEVKVPKGYKLDTKTYEFKITSENQVVKKLNTNEMITQNKEENNSIKNTETNETTNNKEENKIESNTENEVKQNGPQTGDSNMLPYISLFVLSSLGIVVSISKKYY